MKLPRPPQRSPFLPVGLALCTLVAAAGCWGGSPGDDEDDYVPPVLLSSPETPLVALAVADAGELTRSARHLRTELQRFADTASSHVRSYPAARCCPQALRELLVGAHRWDASAEGGQELVPILERLVNEPHPRNAPGLVDQVLHRIAGPGAPPR